MNAAAMLRKLATPANFLTVSRKAKATLATAAELQAKGLVRILPHHNGQVKVVKA